MRWDENWSFEPLSMLEIAPCEADPVTIIAAAQLKLRRWRRVSLAAESDAAAPRAREAWQRIREIIEARDTLLGQRQIPLEKG
jgi:hypothetical protein